MALHAVLRRKMVKINFIDLPGYSTFITEAKSLADRRRCGIDYGGRARWGAQVTTEKALGLLHRVRHYPRAFVLTWMDRELSSFERAMEVARAGFLAATWSHCNSRSARNAAFAA